MNGGERECSKCVHGPNQDACDVYQQARQTFVWMPYGGMYCGYMERRTIAERIDTAARRMASEWPERRTKR